MYLWWELCYSSLKAVFGELCYSGLNAPLVRIMLFESKSSLWWVMLFRSKCTFGENHVVRVKSSFWWVMLFRSKCTFGENYVVRVKSSFWWELCCYSCLNVSLVRIMLLRVDMSLWRRAVILPICSDLRSPLYLAQTCVVVLLFKYIYLLFYLNFHCFINWSMLRVDPAASSHSRSHYTVPGSVYVAPCIYLAVRGGARHHWHPTCTSLSGNMTELFLATLVSLFLQSISMSQEQKLNGQALMQMKTTPYLQLAIALLASDSSLWHSLSPLVHWLCDTRCVSWKPCKSYTGLILDENGMLHYRRTREYVSSAVSSFHWNPSAILTLK
jgi:hypothetical protein